MCVGRYSCESYDAAQGLVYRLKGYPVEVASLDGVSQGVAFHEKDLKPLVDRAIKGSSSGKVEIFKPLVVAG